MVGVIDVASDAVETPEEVADTIGRALQFVPRERLIACTNCGLAPMRREVAEAKLEALARGRGARRASATRDGAARPADHAAGRPPRRCASAGHAVLDAGRLAHCCRRRLAGSTRCGRPGTTCRPTRYLRDGGRYRRRRHACFVVGGDEVAPVPHRAHWQPVEYNALHGGIERWFEPIEPAVVAQPAWHALLRRAGPARVGAARRAAVVRRGAPVPHRHHRRHRPADARRRAPRRRRSGGRAARRPRRREGRRDARVRGRRPARHALHDARAVDHAAARRCARDPRDHADPAARGARPSRHAGADLRAGGFQGAG